MLGLRSEPAYGRARAWDAPSWPAGALDEWMCVPWKSSMQLRTGKSNSTQKNCWGSGYGKPARKGKSKCPSFIKRDMANKAIQLLSLPVPTGTGVLEKLFSVSYKPSEMFTHALYFTIRNGQKNIIGAFHCRKIEWVPSLCKTEWADMTVGVTNTIQWITSSTWFSDIFSTSTRDNGLKSSVLKGSRFLSGLALFGNNLLIPPASWRDVHRVSWQNMLWPTTTGMCLSLQ